MKFTTMTATRMLLPSFAFVFGIAQAQTFSVFHNFSGGAGDGANPLNGLVADKAGNIYGTGNQGGTSGSGAVFKITAAGQETVLYSFKGGSDGANPEGVLILDKVGNLYGTTTGGGAFGAGTVFGVNAEGQEMVLYSFKGGADGMVPEAGLAWDPEQNLYGTTTGGGANGYGVVFKLSPPAQKGSAWTESVLYSFGAGTDGAVPVGGVAFDIAGNLYGTTSAGGTAGFGTVFELSPSGSGWTETILHDFQDLDDGAVPYAGLLFFKGNFYGGATEGGTAGGGTIYELSQVNKAWTFSVLYSVPGSGISGAFRDLAMDEAGTIYGTTHCDGAYSAGTVYELTRKGGSWTYDLLYTFTGGSDGLYSYSNLVLESGGIYGTTNQGGANGLGVVFQIVPDEVRFRR